MADTSPSSSGGPGTTIASAVITGLAAIAVALRFYVRTRTKAGIAWDDWWIFIGLLLTLLTGGLLLWGVSVDPDGEDAIEQAIINKTANTFDTAPHTTYLKLSFICSILYFSIVTAIKASILLMYRRIFSINRTFRLQSLLLGIVVVAFWLAATIATLLNCRPLRYSWIGLSMKEHCFNYNIFWMATGAVEIVIDTIILALPVRMVMNLQLSQKSKISIIIIFLLGGFVIITGILRVIYGYASGSRVPSYSGAGLWSAIHTGMAIVCACLPTLRALFTSVEVFASTRSSIRRHYHALRRRDSHGTSNTELVRHESGGRYSKRAALEKSVVTIVIEGQQQRGDHRAWFGRGGSVGSGSS